MQTHPQHFPKGTAFKIRNRKTLRFLSAKLKEVDSLPANDSEQCWIIEEVRDNLFEIVEMRSGEMLTWPPGRASLKIQRARNSPYSLWVIDLAETTKGVTYFWIKPFRDSSLTLSASALSSKVKVSAIDRTLEICLWQFVECHSKEQYFNGLSIIQSEHSKLALEVPECSIKEGASITQGQYRGCGNQRWIIQTYCDQRGMRHNEYIIRNFCSGLILTANLGRNGGRVTQECFKCEENQRWRLLSAGEGTFLLQSVGNQQFYLTSNQNGVGLTREGGKLAWMIQGDY